MGSLQRRIAAIRLIINGDKLNQFNIALDTNAILVPFLPITKIESEVIAQAGPFGASVAFACPINQTL